MHIAVAAIPLNNLTYDSVPGWIMGGIVILTSIAWMCLTKPKYHVVLSISAGEIHLLTSRNKTYIEKVVTSINETIVKYQ